MSEVRQLSALSTRHLLEALGCPDARAFESEMSLQSACMPREGWSMEPELLQVLYCYARARRPHTVVEIGTHKGVSASVIASALQRSGYGHLYTVDVNLGGQLGHAYRRFRSLGVSDRITVIQKESRLAFRDWGRAGIDLLILDGSHEFVDVCCDFALWARYVVPSGLIVIHDTVTRLLRRFPEDYIAPLSAYNVLNVCAMEERPSGHEWEGCGFVTHA